MAIDYRERKTSPAKNRPRKQPVSALVVAFALVIIAAYGLGVATGWLFFRIAPKPMTVAKPANVQLPAPPVAAAGPSTATGNTSAPPPTQPTPLTFYDTLPKGERAVMGSGFNPKAAETTSKDTAAPQPPTHDKQAAAPNAQPPKAKPEAKPEAKTNTAPSQPVAPKNTQLQPVVPVKKAGYAVQVASTKERADAESIKSRLSSQGKTAYILTSQVKDKGTWYRVRVGHNLEEGKARDLARSLGSGAVIVQD